MDRRLNQAGAFSVLQRYLAEDLDAPIDFPNGLAAPLYAALTTCRNGVSAHAVIVSLGARLDKGAPGNVTEVS